MSVIEDIAGREIRDSIRTTVTVPTAAFGDRFNAPRNTALGLAHTRSQLFRFRPPNRSSAARNVYFVGQDTNPGGGIPACLLGARRTAAAVAADNG